MLLKQRLEHSIRLGDPVVASKPTHRHDLRHTRMRLLQLGQKLGIGLDPSLEVLDRGGAITLAVPELVQPAVEIAVSLRRMGLISHWAARSDRRRSSPAATPATARPAPASGA